MGQLVKTIRDPLAGALSITIWENEHEGRKFYSCSVQCRKKINEEWKEVSYTAKELMALPRLCNEALDVMADLVGEQKQLTRNSFDDGARTSAPSLSTGTYNDDDVPF